MPPLISHPQPLWWSLTVVSVAGYTQRVATNSFVWLMYLGDWLLGFLVFAQERDSLELSQGVGQSPPVYVLPW